jgi:hypothetical protein
MVKGARYIALAATVITVAATPAAASAADAFPLVGWWPMNEGSGQVVRDWSLNGNNGRLGETSGADSHDPTWIRGVLLGSALRFDGDDYIRIPDSPSLEPQQITVAAWFRGTATPGVNKYLMGKGVYNCDHSSYALYTSASQGMAFYIADGDRWFRSPEAPATVWDGKWHHAAGTFDGQKVRLFIDGIEVGEGTPAVTSIAYDQPTSDGGTIGNYHGTYQDTSCDLYMNGDIDGVQVWSKALPVADIWRTLKSLVTLAR